MPTSSAPPAPICYVEIPAPNPEQAARFYGAVFKWTAEPSGLTELNYWMFQTGSGQLIGGFTAEKPVHPSGIVFYIRVDDIPAALKDITTAGGTVLSEKEGVGGDYGYTAIFKDPSGNTIGLWSQT